MKDKFKSGEIIKVKFGEPTIMEQYEGYWKQPKNISGTESKLCLVDQSKYWNDKDNIKIVGDLKAEILAVERIEGCNAGFRIITLKVK